MRLDDHGFGTLDAVRNSGRSADFGGFPVPSIYASSFAKPPEWASHPHRFWSTAEILYVVLPPPPGFPGGSFTSALIDALASALVADLLADMSHSESEKADDLR